MFRIDFVSLQRRIKDSSMDTNMNVNISLPQSEFSILKKMAKSLGWNLFVSQENEIKEEQSLRKQRIEKLYGCIQLPNDFDYKKELEESIADKYKL